MTIQEIIESIDYCLKCNNDSIPTTQKDLQTIKGALEKQIPKKLKTIEVGLSGLVFLCPSCENEMAMMYDSVWQKGKYKQKCCDNCGQALDWNDLKGETK